MKYLFFLGSFLLLCVFSAVQVMAQAVVEPSNAGFITAVVGVLRQFYPDQVSDIFAYAGLAAYIAQLLPEKKLASYESRRWYQWIVWAIHRFGGNNGAASNNLS